ncbi:hypothetical protein [Saezia sanguinis]|uniref:hypothetical protein n=1 Tax=Saezia sanguinis TaxID=1965230 RepID=UPI00303F0C33
MEQLLKIGRKMAHGSNLKVGIAFDKLFFEVLRFEVKQSGTDKKTIVFGHYRFFVKLLETDFCR